MQPAKDYLLPHANSQIHKIVMGMQHPLNYVIPYTAVIKWIPLMPGAKWLTTEMFAIIQPSVVKVTQRVVLVALMFNPNGKI